MNRKITSDLAVRTLKKAIASQQEIKGVLIFTFRSGDTEAVLYEAVENFAYTIYNHRRPHSYLSKPRLQDYRQRKKGKGFRETARYGNSLKSLYFWAFWGPLLLCS